ncbi:unnamed protein product [Closterium sp. Naga37s-1]|nr:unnamed protein product [Closterium sp. Naga37s-1]
MPCAADIAALCPNATSSTTISSAVSHAAQGVVVAEVGQCLVDQPLAKLSSESCRQLVAVVGVAGAHVGGVVDEARLESTLAEIAQVRLLEVAHVAQIAQVMLVGVAHVAQIAQVMLVGVAHVAQIAQVMLVGVAHVAHIAQAVVG